MMEVEDTEGLSTNNNIITRSMWCQKGCIFQGLFVIAKIRLVM